jgi:tRNA(Ile)-lysidine synthase
MPRTLLQKLEQDETLRQGTRLLVGVSGGVDSVVLLHLLCQLSPLRSLTLSVAHLDHAIRPESGEDAHFVGQLCGEWGVPFTVERVDVPALARSTGQSLEMAAREARHAFLFRLAEEQDADYIVLGHHRDDQAETFLLRLLRGSGLSGLSAMRHRRGRWLRPLLAASRQQLEDYAREQGLQWREDASNEDPRHLRNRVRHQLMPRLREFNPRLEERLDLLCRQLQAEEDFWTQQVEDVLPGVLLSGRDGVRLCRTGLLKLHPALRVRLLREAIRRVRGDLQRLEEKHLVAVEGLLSAEQSQASLDLPGVWVARRYEQLWLREASPKLDAYSFELQPPGQVVLPDGSCINAEFDSVARGESAEVVEFSAEQLQLPLRVRNFVEGDRFRPFGSSGGKKLKDYFIDLKLEAERRLTVPLVLSGDRIIWVAGLRRSSIATAGENTAQILRLRLIQP